MKMLWKNGVLFSSGILPPSSVSHGYVGLLIIIFAEVLLFSGNELVGSWFTPIVWTGYILFVDALVLKLTKRSLLTTDRLEMLITIVASIAAWWLFEFYNAPRFWRSDLELWWHYHNLEPNLFLRRVGYDWAFATIFPAMFLTARLLMATTFKKNRFVRQRRPTKTILLVGICIGAIASFIPFAFPSPWLAPLVWLAPALLLDPINYLRGWPSTLGDLTHGNYRRVFALLSSGALCGVLWEFWNYWAISKWTYTVPYFGNMKIFEMPVLGYLGFPPFAVECWVMYIFFRSLLSPKPLPISNIWVDSVSDGSGRIVFGVGSK